MKTSQSFRIYFTIKSDKEKDGKAPLYVVVTINKEKCFIALKQNGYTTTCSPGNLNTMIALVVNYYGNTDAPGRPTVYTAPANASSRTTGLLTASKVNVLGTTAMLWSVNYYDEEGRNIKTYAQHYRNATASVNNYDEVSTVYDFTDQVTSTSRKHYTNGTLGTGGALTLGLTVNTRYEYDHIGRKTKTYQQTGTAGSQEVLLSNLTYNEIGKLW
jgi:hypothetical protein